MMDISSLHLFVVPHFHYDVAYLRTYEEYLPVCFENLREALAIMEEDNDYCFLIEQVILLEEFEKRCPQDWERLEYFARQGRIEVACGMWVMPDMNIPDGESLIRQALFGKRWVKAHLGLDVKTAWIADCWGHHGQIPQIMRHCGFRYYAFARGMREVFKTEFLWRGIDGSELLCHWLSQGYGAIRFPSEAEIVHKEEQQIAEVSQENLEQILLRFEPYLTGKSVLLGNGGDFARPQRSAPHIVKQWRKKGLNVRFAKTTDFFAALEEQRSQLPIYEGELNPLLQGTYASRIRLKQTNRRLEKKLEALERLSAVLAQGYDEVLADRLERLWKKVLRNQFHDVIAGTMVDAAFDEAMQLYHQAEKDIDRLIQDQLARLSSSLPSDQGILVFNPSGFARREIISVPGEEASGVVEVLDEAGNILPSQPDRIAGTSGRVLVEVEVPPLSWRSYQVRSGTGGISAPAISVSEEPLRIENAFYRISFAPSGVIASVVDKTSGTEFVDPQRPWWGDLVYHNDYGDLYLYDKSPLNGGGLASFCASEQKRGVYDPSPDPLVVGDPLCQHQNQNRMEVVENGPLRTTVKVSGDLRFWQNRIEFVQWISIYQNRRRIDFRTEIMPRGKHYRLNVAFPTNIRDGRIRHEIPFGLQVRDEREYAAQNWIDYSDDQKGVCLLNKGLPGNAVCRGVLTLSLFRSVAMEYKGPTAKAFEEGVPHCFEYSVLPFVNGQPYRPWQEGEILNMPLLLLSTQGTGSARRSVLQSAGLAEGSYLVVEPENVVLSGLYRSGAGVVIRFYEAKGVSTLARVRFPLEIKACWEADALENVGKELQVQNGQISFKLKPFEIKSFVVEPVRKEE